MARSSTHMCITYMHLASEDDFYQVNFCLWDHPVMYLITPAMIHVALMNKLWVYSGLERSSLLNDHFLVVLICCVADINGLLWIFNKASLRRTRVWGHGPLTPQTINISDTETYKPYHIQALSLSRGLSSNWPKVPIIPTLRWSAKERARMDNLIK